MANCRDIMTLSASAKTKITWRCCDQQRVFQRVSIYVEDSLILVFRLCMSLCMGLMHKRNTMSINKYQDWPVYAVGKAQREKRKKKHLRVSTTIHLGSSMYPFKYVFIWVLGTLSHRNLRHCPSIWL